MHTHTQAPGSILGAHEAHEMHEWTLSMIGCDSLAPTLRALGREGLTIGHFTLLRQDPRRLTRVARAIRAGGYEMNKEEEAAFDLFGERRMQLAAQVQEVWGLEGLPQGSRRIHYSKDVLSRAATDGWRLVYVTGQPLDSLYRQALRHPLIDARAMSIHALPGLKKWAAHYIAPRPGYYLLRQISPFEILYGRGGDIPQPTWEDQERAITTLDPSSARAKPALVLEASISDLFIVGYEIRCGSAWAHSVKIGPTEKPVSLYVGGIIRHEPSETKGSAQGRGYHLYLQCMSPPMEHPCAPVFAFRQYDC